MPLTLYVNLETGDEFRADAYEAFADSVPAGYVPLNDVPKERLWALARKWLYEVKIVSEGHERFARTGRFT
jgi:hypothetical protein